MTIEIANRLCAYRKKQGLSQEELAEKIGVSRQAVSKWERAEASPDTDNLILLSQVYGVTLDELLNKDPEETENEEAAAEQCINIDTDDGDKVRIDRSGIHVDSKDGDKVHIGIGGIHINSNETVDIEDDNFEESRRGLKFGLTVAAWAMLCVIAYLLFGCFGVCGGWAFGWIVFLTVPIYASVGEAIAKRNAEEFCYPVFVTLVYLILGLEFTWWHPGWIIFLTVPVYYTICHAIKKLRK